MPSVLCFDTAAAETLRALDRIRANLHRKMRGTMRTPKSKRTGSKIQNLGRHLSFEKIESITPAAALVLAAEYERPLHNRSDFIPFLYNTKSWSKKILHTLEEIGFFSIVGFKGNHPKTDYDSDQYVFPMQSGKTTDTEAITTLVRNLKDLYPDRDDVSEANLLRLYGAMVEAVGNVVNHAYPKDGVFSYPHIGRWWMTGAVDRVARSTTAVVFDQGVTIPCSLPTWNRYAGVQRRVLTTIGQMFDQAVGSSLGIPLPSDPRADAFAILAAVEESVSSTEEAHRGHGLAQMREFVNQCREGRLRIMSRNGEVIYRPGKPPETRAFDVSIGGTLIEWSVVI